MGSVPAAPSLGHRAPRVHGPVSSPRRRPHARTPSPPSAPGRALARRHRPGPRRNPARRKPGRRPSPDLSPAGRPARDLQANQGAARAAQPTTAGPTAAALTSARRPALGPRRSATLWSSRFAVGTVWGGVPSAKPRLRVAHAHRSAGGAPSRAVCALGPIVRLCSQASAPTLMASRGSSLARPREHYCWVSVELFRAVDRLCQSAHARRGRGTCQEARGPAGRAFPTGHAPLGMRSALPRLFRFYPLTDY